jgi:hypothetical protein
VPWKGAYLAVISLIIPLNPWNLDPLSAYETADD